MSFGLQKHTIAEFQEDFLFIYLDTTISTTQSAGMDLWTSGIQTLPMMRWELVEYYDNLTIKRHSQTQTKFSFVEIFCFHGGEVKVNPKERGVKIGYFQHLSESFKYTNALFFAL